MPYPGCHIEEGAEGVDLDLHKFLLQITDINLGQSKLVLQSLLDIARETLAVSGEYPIGRAEKLAKKMRRQAKVTGSSLG